MKALLFAVLAGISCGSAFAGWSVEKCGRISAPSGLEAFRIRAASAGGKAVLHIVRFRPRTHAFAVMDDPEKAFDLASASKKRGALAAVNGGYFHPDRTPLGLVIRQGRTIHPQERANLLSGLVIVKDRRPALLRAGEFKSARGVREALQTGPFLVDDGRSVKGLNATRPAARTFVFAQDDGWFGLGVSDAVTLSEIGNILATSGMLPGGKVARALNLDGGSSTGLWIAGKEPLYLREGKDVRNFLAIVPRP